MKQQASPSQPSLYIGLMSGTSLDGIDAALVEFSSTSKFTVHRTAFTPYPEELKNRLRHVCLTNPPLANCNETPLHIELAAHYANAALDVLQDSGFNKQRVMAIACHGQTVHHDPTPGKQISIQLGDGQEIANLSDIPCINQFRQADLAAGGQGAPLMPAFHRVLFDEQSESIFLVNIGGIANITHISEPLVGFDTGPGNCLMDGWIEQQLGVPFDQDGHWAKTGSINTLLLEQMLKDPYFAKRAPKSTGTDYFSPNWLKQFIDDTRFDLTPADIQATLSELTARSIANETLKLGKRGELIVCGGGAKNTFLIERLEVHLADFSVSSSDVLGVPADHMEAIGFAWLGYCFDQGIPANEHSVTGAKRKVVLGEKKAPAIG